MVAVQSGAQAGLAHFQRIGGGKSGKLQSQIANQKCLQGLNIPGKPPPMRVIIFENFPIFFIICCI